MGRIMNCMHRQRVVHKRKRSGSNFKKKVKKKCFLNYIIPCYYYAHFVECLYTRYLILLCQQYTFLNCFENIIIIHILFFDLFCVIIHSILYSHYVLFPYILFLFSSYDKKIYISIAIIIITHFSLFVCVYFNFKIYHIIPRKK